MSNFISPFMFHCQPALPAVFDDSLSYYHVVCKIAAKLNEVIASQNNVIEDFNALKEYVDNYFKGLDVQQMIRDALDEMAEDGTLAQIINEEIFNELNTKVANNENDINNLKAITVNAVDYGAKGDGSTDDSAAFINAINACPIGGTVTMPPKSYFINATLNINKNITVDLNGSTLIMGNGTIEIAGSIYADKIVPTNDITKDATTLTLPSSANIIKNSTVFISSTEMFNTSRTYYRKGGIFSVENINNNQLTVTPAFPFSAAADTITVQACAPVTAEIKNGAITSNMPTPSLYLINISYGLNCKLINLKLSKASQLVRWNFNYGGVIDNIFATDANDEVERDHYGISIITSTAPVVCNSFINAGQHAITGGGNECTLYIRVDNCVLSGETRNQAYGDHENCQFTTITNSILQGVGLGGNSLVSNCKIYNSATPQTEGCVLLAPQDNKLYANYKFINCSITDQLFMRGYPQVSSYTGVIGSVDMVNCDLLNFRVNSTTVTNVDAINFTNCNLTTQTIDTNSTINSINFQQCNLISISDQGGSYNLSMVDSICTGNIDIQSTQNATPPSLSFNNCTVGRIFYRGNINNLFVEKCTITGSTAIICANGKTANIISIKDCTFNPASNTFELTGVQYLSISNLKPANSNTWTMLISLSNNISLDNIAPNTLTLVSCANVSAKSLQCTIAASSINGCEIMETTASKLNGTIQNVVTGSTGKFYITPTASGFTFTPVA